MVAWPGDKLSGIFSTQVEPMVRLTKRNESMALAATRDLLLPKLMSGDIRVKDAEKIAVNSL
jgi:type I restriction enzyme S subunit